jgi:hypothetical protein
MKRSILPAVICSLFSLFFSLSPQQPQKISLALIDTAERDTFLYQPALDIFASVGFTVHYLPLDNVIDTPLKLEHYDAAFFLFGNEFLSGNRQGHLWGKIVRALQQYACRKDKLVGLFFPSLPGLKPTANIIEVLMPLFQALGIGLVQMPWHESVLSWANMSAISPSVNDFMQLTNTFLVNALEARPLRYHTTLNMPHGGIFVDTEQIQKEVSQRSRSLFLLPRNTSCSEIVRQTLPYGVYWFNPLYKNHVLISTTSLLTFAGISENFRFCPIDIGIRQEMLAMVQRMLWDVVCLAKPHSSSEQPELPASITSLGFISPGSSRERGLKTAWMEIAVFDESEVKSSDELVQRRAQQDKIIEYIFQSGLDALWITFNPHMYYSPIARHKGKEQSWLQSIACFTKKLNTGAILYKSSVPRILIGFEITNNIYEPYLPKVYPVDVYENGYADLPLPASRVFWQREVIEPLKKFVEQWQDTTISHGISLSGVVLDLEMYCRRNAGLFSSTMTIDADTFSRFDQQAQNLSVRDRVLRLTGHGKAKKYFNFLEGDAYKIGTYLNTECVRCIPNCQLMCYLPNVQVSWFYKGLYRGLSQAKRPLHILTFNSEFFAHESWFKRNKIPIKHSTVLMLSKLTSEQDFNLVDVLISRHHGLWLNRFSRFVEPASRDWTSLEQPAIPESSYPAFMKYLHEH